MKTPAALALLLVSGLLPVARPCLAAGSSLPVLVIVGLKDEADLVRGPGVEVVISANNAALLRSRLKRYDRSKVRAVVSFGVAGGLSPNLHAGDLMLPKTTVSGAQQWQADPALWAALKKRLAGVRASGIEVATDKLSGSTPKERAALRAATGADAVDNESQAAGDFARAQGLPFAVVRAVSDTSDFSLPPAALVPLRSDGTVNYSAVDASIAADPGQIPALMKLNGDHQAAMRALKAAAGTIGFASLPVSGAPLVPQAAAAVAALSR